MQVIGLVKKSLDHAGERSLALPRHPTISLPERNQISTRIVSEGQLPSGKPPLAACRTPSRSREDYSGGGMCSSRRMLPKSSGALLIIKFEIRSAIQSVFRSFGPFWDSSLIRLSRSFNSVAYGVPL